MTNNGFDETLRHIVQDEEIPYKEMNWVSLRQRMDKDSKLSMLLLLPISYKAYAAACVTAILCFSWFANKEGKPVYNIAQQYTPEKAVQTVSPITTTPLIHHLKTKAPKKRVYAVQQEQVANNFAATYTVEDTSTQTVITQSTHSEYAPYKKGNLQWYT